MSDHLERVLLTNVPDFLDGWVLKSTIPCGGLIHRVEISPSNSSKMMIFTKGQDSAQKIASILDNYNFCGSVIRARYIFVKPPEASKVKVTNSSSADAHSSKQPGNMELNEIRADVKKNYDADDDKTLVGHSGNNMQRQLKLMSTDSVPQKVSRCRFCRRSSHVTWLCPQNAEYYKVSRTTKGMNPAGYQWPESSVVKVEGLCAGPIIQLIEKSYLQMEKMNAEEMRIMFAWLTNYLICHNCGAAGHRETDADAMCKYLSMGCPVTDDMITRLRRPFCRRMNDIREQVSFGKLQQYAHICNLQFRDSMGIKDGRLLKYPIKRKEEDKEENLVRKVSRVPPQRPALLDSPADMLDTLERVLLTNVPDFLDGWVLKSTIPCGGLVERVEINPLNSSKMMILTKGQDNAQKIASMLDNYNVCGSVIRAWHIFVKPPEGPQAVTDSSTVERTQGEIEKTSNGDTIDGLCNKNNLQRPRTTNRQPTRVENEKLRQDRKRRSSVAASSTEKLKGAGRDESTVKSSKTSSRGSSRSRDLQSKDSLPRSKQAKGSSSQESRSCRFCLQSGHATWSCKERAEYCKVAWTTKGINPPGYEWPESSIVKVEELYAGPVIEYMEKNRLGMDKMNREQIRIMFAWLTNYMVCHDCGAAGHRTGEGLCKYLPVDPPLTEEMITEFRRPFCRRMKGIRDKLPFGKLQQQARRVNQTFSDGMNVQDGQPLKFSIKEEEKPQRDNAAELTDTTGGEHSPREDLRSITLVEKRMKIAQRDDYERDTDDDDEEDEEELL